jgi:hypothetical protein
MLLAVIRSADALPRCRGPHGAHQVAIDSGRANRPTGPATSPLASRRRSFMTASAGTRVHQSRSARAFAFDDRPAPRRGRAGVQVVLPS